MALIPFQEYCKNNPYGFTAQRIRYILKNDASAEKVLRRISSRSIFIDEEALEDWIQSKRYYSMKRKKKAI